MVLGRWLEVRSFVSCLGGGKKVRGDVNRSRTSRAVWGTSTLDMIWSENPSGRLQIYLGLLQHVLWRYTPEMTVLDIDDHPH